MAVGNISKALSHYGCGYNMITTHAPAHALTSAFHYKLGNIQLINQNYTICLYVLSYFLLLIDPAAVGLIRHDSEQLCQQGITIAVHRNLRGDTARLLHLKAKCLEVMHETRANSESTHIDEDSMQVAQEARECMRAQMTSQEGCFEQDLEVSVEELADWDSLVCAYHR